MMGDLQIIDSDVATQPVRTVVTVDTRLTALADECKSIEFRFDELDRRARIERNWDLGHAVLAYTAQFPDISIRELARNLNSLGVRMGHSHLSVCVQVVRLALSQGIDSWESLEASFHTWTDIKSRYLPVHGVDSEVSTPEKHSEADPDPDHEEEPAPELSVEARPVPRAKVDSALRYLYDKLATGIPIVKKDLFHAEHLLGLTK